MTNRDLPDAKQLGVYTSLAQVGLEMVAPIVIGLFVDSKLGWAPWGTIAGAVLGLVGGMVHLVAILNRKNSGSTQRPRDEP